MTKPRSRTISKPFDARHVGGVSVQGATIPIVGIDRASTGLEPDETPSHTFVATGNVEIPRRSNTIASSLSRPSLRLKTSMARLTGRSSSNSPDTHRKREIEPPPASESSPQTEMQAPSLRKKPSSSKLWQRVHHDAATREPPPRPKLPEKEPPITPPEKDTPLPKLKPSIARLTSTTSTTSISSPDHHHQHVPRAPPPPPSQKKANPLPPVRPKRADSGTAIDFDDVPPEQRPMGFREILAVAAFEERMALYKRTREYWANADHGLGEWVGRTGRQRSVAFRV